MENNQFSDLVRQLSAYHVAADEANLHGLLSGFATIPAMDSRKLVAAIAGEQALAEAVIEKVLECIGLIAAELSEQAFEARFDSDDIASAGQWLDGYFEAVALHESDWEALNEDRPRAGASLLALHSMKDPKFERDLGMGLPGPSDLRNEPQLVSIFVQNIYDWFHYDPNDESALPYEDAYSWDDFSDAELSAMDELALMAIVTSREDTLTIEVVRECARRGEAMVPVLRRHLEEPGHWGWDADPGDWWALLHATLILGLIPGDASAQALLHAFRKINFDKNCELSDWLSSAWPALCRNKREFTTGPLRLIAEDTDAYWYARCQAIDCVLEAAAEKGGYELDRAIDWLAAMCANPAEDSEFRVIAGNSLLDFPRERHRQVMEALVDLQEPDTLTENAFGLDEIQHSFDGGDSPGWKMFDNPWRFYDPGEIAVRQKRWESEALDLVDSGREQTYVREEPKIGRNEACPCGSGKKYKKCCMNAQH
jgi:hypothetical protein